MKYMGSKNRYSKYLLPIILQDRKPNTYYVEPFVGGANLIDKVDGLRIGSDNNLYLITLLKAIQDGFQPPDFVSNRAYIHSKQEMKNEVVNPLVAFVGFNCSFGGKFFGGYARGKSAKGLYRNYSMESRRNMLLQRDGILGIQFIHSSYDELYIPPNSIVYCDPPYNNTTGYSSVFDNTAFWEWANGLI